MNIAKKIAFALAAIGVFAAPILATNIGNAAMQLKIDPSSSYNTNSSTCNIGIYSGTANEGANRLGESGSQFRALDNATVATNVIIQGDDNCEKTITLASWSAQYGTNNLLPIEKQSYFTHKTYTLKKGTHTVSVTHNDCRFQVDMLYGSSPWSPSGQNALYPEAQKLGWVLGGSKVCLPPVTPPKTCPDGTPAPNNDPSKCPQPPVTCPDGSTAPQNDASKCPVKCPDGTPAPGNDASKCPQPPVKCPDGSNAPSNDPSKCPVKCPDGTNAPQNDTSKCPQPPVKCPDGTNAPNNDTSKCPQPPVKCPDGSNAPQNDTSKCPVKCPNGTPAPQNDMSKCPQPPVNCPDGTTAPQNDASKCPQPPVECDDESAPASEDCPEECDENAPASKECPKVCPHMPATSTPVDDFSKCPKPCTDANPQPAPGQVCPQGETCTEASPASAECPKHCPDMPDTAPVADLSKCPQPVTPAAPVAPTEVETKPVALPAVLPATGPASIAAIFGLTVVAGSIAHYFVQRRRTDS